MHSRPHVAPTRATWAAPPETLAPPSLPSPPPSRRRRSWPSAWPLGRPGWRRRGPSSSLLGGARQRPAAPPRRELRGAQWGGPPQLWRHPLVPEPAQGTAASFFSTRFPPPTSTVVTALARAVGSGPSGPDLILSRPDPGPRWLVLAWWPAASRVAAGGGCGGVGGRVHAGTGGRRFLLCRPYLHGPGPCAGGRPGLMRRLGLLRGWLWSAATFQFSCPRRPVWQPRRRAGAGRCHVRGRYGGGGVGR